MALRYVDEVMDPSKWFKTPRKLPAIKPGNKGQMGNPVTLVIYTAALLMIGAMVLGSLTSAIDTQKTGYSEDAQTAINATEENAWTAYQLMPIGLLVLGAASVMAYLAFFRGG